MPGVWWITDAIIRTFVQLKAVSATDEVIKKHNFSISIVDIKQSDSI